MVEFGSRNVFPTDPTDAWGNVHSIGNAELAARLWSINTYDRRGNVVFMDNFDEPVLKWNTAMIGAPVSSVSLSTLYSRVAGNSVRLAVGTGVNFYAAIWKYLPLPIETKLGMEASFTIPTNIDRLGISFALYTGTELHESGFFYSRTDDVLYLYNVAIGTPTSIVASDVNPFVSDYAPAVLFHTMKLVIDYKTNKYLRVMFDNKEYDVSDIGYKVTSPHPWGSSVIVGLWAVNNNVGTPVVYVDDAICTQNEPLNAIV